VNLPAGKKSALHLSVCNHPGGDFELIVTVNGKELLRKLINDALTNKQWIEERVDLGEFAGQTATIEIRNHPNNWKFEHAFWRKIAIE
jgi:hypothetical protein